MKVIRNGRQQGEDNTKIQHVHQHNQIPQLSWVKKSRRFSFSKKESHEG